MCGLSIYMVIELFLNFLSPSMRLNMQFYERYLCIFVHLLNEKNKECYYHVKVLIDVICSFYLQQ